jgi:PAS domain S-box-containing protein
VIAASGAFGAAIISTSQDAIYVLSPAGDVLHWNPSAIRIYGHTPDDVIGRPGIAFLSNDPQEAAEIFSRVLEGELVEHYRGNGTRKDGTSFPVALTVSPCTDADGSIVAVSVIARDESQYVQLEQAMRQAAKMEAIGRLAGGVAHDFNNLLTVIKGNTSVWLKAHETEVDSERILEVLRAAEQAAALTEQLLRFSRSEPATTEAIDVNQIIQRAASVLTRLIGENVKLVLDLDEHLPLAAGDPVLLDQTIMNLAVNARDAMPGGGTLTFATTTAVLDKIYLASHLGITPGRYIELSVTDTGTGMSPEVRERLFEPFFTTKPAGQGTGLGLSSVYGNIEQSGGHIWVYSEEGLGTTFKVYLPTESRLASPEAPPPEREVEDEFPGGSETILLIEDRDIVRDTAHTILTDAGYRVIATGSPTDAFRALGDVEHPVHLLISDLVMPEMSGVEVMQTAREGHPDLPVVLMSGYAGNALIEGGLTEPNTYFLPKPFAAADLLGIVATALEPLRRNA